MTSVDAQTLGDDVVNGPSLTWRDEESRPIFIGGDGRSGTTLLAVILDSHPQVWMGQELHFKGPDDLGPSVLRCLEHLKDAEKPMKGPPEVTKDSWRRSVQFIKRVRRSGIDDSVLRAAVESAMRSTASDLSNFDQRCALVAELGSRAAHRAGKSRWGFKIMKAIKDPRRFAAAFPRGTFVHIYRDGRDVAASQMVDHSSWGYPDIESAARGWVAVVEGARRSAPTNFAEISLEDLVSNPLTSMGRVAAAMDIPWHDSLLHHDEQAHDFFSSDVAHPSREMVRQPLNRGSIGRFQRDLSPADIATFELIAGGALVERGYVLTPSR